MNKIPYTIQKIGDKRLLYFDTLEPYGLSLYLTGSDFFAPPISESQKIAQLEEIYQYLGIEKKHVFAGYQVHSANVVKIPCDFVFSTNHSSKNSLSSPNSNASIEVSDMAKSNQKAADKFETQESTQNPVNHSERVEISKKSFSCTEGSFQSTDSEYYGYEFDQTDGLITDNPSFCLATKFADCTPIVLFDPTKKVLASLHSGWRGTQQKIAARAIEMLTENYFCNKKDLIVFIGPAIAAEDFEVGEDLVNLFEQSYGNISEYLTAKESGKYLFDMRRLIVNQLIRDGVAIEKIYTTELETYRNPMMHSHRRDKTDAGRMILFAMQKNPL